MNPTLKTRIAVACGLVLCLAAALPASAASGFQFHSSQGTLVLDVNGYDQIHGTLVNTGDAADTYHLSVTKDFPESWTLGVCYDGICYPPANTEFTVPAEGALAPGEEMVFDLDITTLFDEGPGTFTLTFWSETNPALRESRPFEVLTPTAGGGFVFSYGSNVIEAEVNEFVELYGHFYNAGDTPDSYTITASRNIPADWTASVCFGGVCYPPNVIEHTLPATGTLAPGDGLEVGVAFTTLFNAGTGSFTLDIVSNTDGSIQGSYTFVCTTEGIVAVGDDLPAPVLGDVSAAPNPFNPRTEIRFAVGGDRVLPAAVAIYDLRGQQVRTLALDRVAPGPQSVSWDGLDDAGRPLGTGVYLARVRVGEHTESVKMTLVK